jgi:hypothetical protein
MRRFFRWLIRGWGSKPVELTSPMSVDAASYVLTSEVSGYGSRLLRGLSLGLGPRIVTGRVEGGYVRLQALRPGIRNSWRPTLVGHIVPMPRGSQLLGELRMNTLVRVFSALWLGIDALFFVGGIVGLVGELLRGDPSKALSSLALAGIALGFAAFFIGLTALGAKMGDNDEAFLRQWLEERLQVPSSHGRALG